MKDLWFYFKKISQMTTKETEKKNSVFSKLKQNQLRESLSEAISKPDFYRYIYGRKVTGNGYYLEIYRLFNWSILEPRLEISILR